MRTTRAPRSPRPRRRRSRSAASSGPRCPASVFDVLRLDRPASAYDVTEQLSAAQGRRVAANSVYRILDLFVASNLAQRIESANAYIANPHPGCRHDCMFLVCDRCGRATHVDNDAVNRTGARRRPPRGVRARNGR